jgi:DNA repair protein RadC
VNVYEAKLSYRVVGEVDSGSLDQPEKAARYMQGCFETYPEQESFWVIGLNRKNNPKFRCMITLGTLESSLVHPREVFKPAIVGSCSSIIIAHNHPSGDPHPSSSDIKVTRTLKQAGEIIGIPVLDHIIIGHQTGPTNRHFSFSEQGLL